MFHAAINRTKATNVIFNYNIILRVTIFKKRSFYFTILPKKLRKFVIYLYDLINEEQFAKDITVLIRIFAPLKFTFSNLRRNQFHTSNDVTFPKQSDFNYIVILRVTIFYEAFISQFCLRSICKIDLIRALCEKGHHRKSRRSNLHFPNYAADISKTKHLQHYITTHFFTKLSLFQSCHENYEDQRPVYIYYRFNKRRALCEKKKDTAVNRAVSIYRPSNSEGSRALPW